MILCWLYIDSVLVHSLTYVIIRWSSGYHDMFVSHIRTSSSCCVTRIHSFLVLSGYGWILVCVYVYSYCYICLLYIVLQLHRLLLFLLLNTMSYSLSHCYAIGSSCLGCSCLYCSFCPHIILWLHAALFLSISLLPQLLWTRGWICSCWCKLFYVVSEFGGRTLSLNQPHFPWNSSRTKVVLSLGGMSISCHYWGWFPEMPAQVFYYISNVISIFHICIVFKYLWLVYVYFLV